MHYLQNDVLHDLNFFFKWQIIAHLIQDVVFQKNPGNRLLWDIFQKENIKSFHEYIWFEGNNKKNNGSDWSVLDL